MKESIDLPTAEEKENSIQFILANVSVQPKSFTQFIRSIFTEMDWRIYFWGLRDILIISVSLIACVFAFFWYVSDFGRGQNPLLLPVLKEQTYFNVFLASPVIFGIFHYLSLWKEVQLKTYELKMTLKISLKDILLVRSIFFSVISLVISVLLSLLAWYGMNQEVSLFKLVSVSSASLFLFLVGQMSLDKKLPADKSYVVSPLIWLSIGTLLVLGREQVSHFILMLPELLVFLLSLVLLVVFILLIRRSYLTEKEGGFSYVGIKKR